MIHVAQLAIDGEFFLVEQIIQKRVTLEEIAAWLENCMRKVD